MNDIAKIESGEIVVDELSDKQLYSLSRECGKRSKVWARRFAVLLVEVARRGLHRKYGFEGIYEFAAKVGGLGGGSVDVILRVGNFLRDKPLLWQEFLKFGWSKLRAVLTIATVESDEYWALKVRDLPKVALEEFVRRAKESEQLDLSSIASVSVPEREGSGGGVALYKPRTVMVPDEGNKFLKLRFKVTVDSEFRFQKLKKGLQQKMKIAVTSGEVLEFLLDRAGIDRKSSGGRGMSLVVRDELISRWGGKCAFPGCGCVYAELHHAERYSLTGSHDRVYPVCRMHHNLFHGGCILNEDKDPRFWSLGDPKRNKKIEEIDENAGHISYRNKTLLRYAKSIFLTIIIFRI